MNARPALHRRYWWCGLVLLLVLARSAAAHNGALAIAVPVEGIKIDGDLSEWPSNMVRYPLTYLAEEHDHPRNLEDFRGEFRIGYNQEENALYLAVEMQDESAVIDTASAAAWNAHDGCEVYVDARHDRSSEVPIGQYSMRDKPGVFGAEASLSELSVAVQWEHQTHRFEWRIDIGRKTRGQVQLRPGGSLGLDIALVDRDRDGSFTWMGWGPQSFKFVSGKLGDVVLAAGSDISADLIQGWVRWENSQEAVAHAQVQVSSARMWVQVTADVHGHFGVGVPPGNYQVRLNWPGSGEAARRVQLHPGRAVQVALTAPLPHGKRVPAGPGKGTWRNFGTAEGLPSQVVYTVYQDREGNMWFGTYGGVARFDGRKVTAFTTREGLAHNLVVAITQARDGSMWFGTVGGGVSRYDGKAFHTLTTKDGLVNDRVYSILEDRQGGLWFGTLSGASLYDGKEFRNYTAREGLSYGVRSITEDRAGGLWFGTGSGVIRYDGKTFHTLTTQDGLASNTIGSGVEDHEGKMWFGTYGGGVSRYDGKGFVNLNVENGLAGNTVESIVVDREGTLWLGTDGGVSRYDGKTFLTLTTKDGLPGNYVTDVYEDREGSLWFGTLDGVSQYLGGQFRTFTTADGLLDNRVVSVLEDRNGALWFGMGSGFLDVDIRSLGASQYDGEGFRSYSPEEGLWAESLLKMDLVEERGGNLWFGPVRYDGKRFRTFTNADGMVTGPAALLEGRQGNIWIGGGTGVSRSEGDHFVPVHDIPDEKGVYSLLEDRHGTLWFGTGSGKVLRYDGKETTVFAPGDTIEGRYVFALYEDRDGAIWAGAIGGGVSRIEAEKTKTWYMTDGLAGNEILAISQDHDGRLLFGSLGGGLSLFDGRVFQNLTTQDGLADNRVTDLLQDRHGDIWISTLGGVTRYRPYRTPPPIQITEVTADRRYGPMQAISLSTSQDYLAFEFQGRSLKTRPGQMAYVYRLQGYDEDWRVTREERVVYADLPRGDYAFEVKAVDRDLTYSEAPATVQVAVHLPYNQLLLYGVLVVSLVGLGLTSGMAMRRRRALLQEQRVRLQAQEQLNRELEEELQTAHDLQMGLMPKSPPHIPGLDIAGQCLPANHVGGDFFQYFQQEGALSLCLADVTGHAMEAAVPGLMFSGVLKSQVELGEPLDLLFQRLNRTLHSTLDAHTFVCFTMGKYDPTTGIFLLADAGCPYPYHYRATTSTIEELRVDAYPLGVRPEGVYPVVQTTLAPGDRVVFCSDGVIEAVNTVGEMFGFERTAEVIRKGCLENLSADKLLGQILTEAKVFRGAAAQGDDQTVVVMRLTD